MRNEMRGNIMWRPGRRGDLRASAKWRPKPNWRRYCMWRRNVRRLRVRQCIECAHEQCAWQASAWRMACWNAAALCRQSRKPSSQEMFDLNIGLDVDVAWRFAEGCVLWKENRDNATMREICWRAEMAAWPSSRNREILQSWSGRPAKLSAWCHGRKRPNHGIIL